MVATSAMPIANTPPRSSASFRRSGHSKNSASKFGDKVRTRRSAAAPRASFLFWPASLYNFSNDAKGNVEALRIGGPDALSLKPGVKDRCRGDGPAKCGLHHG